MKTSVLLSAFCSLAPSPSPHPNPLPHPKMLAALSVVDYGVIALYMAAMMALGVYFSGKQTNTSEFFLGSRSFSWFPLGMSLMATLISALTYTGLPGQAYYVGLKVLIMPLSVWLALPLVVWYVLPIYRGLGLYSVYEYLELRFDARTRLAGSLLFVVWRLLWLGGVIFAPCKALLIATGWNIPDWPLLLVLGLVTTFYTFLGGMRAVIWTDVIQSLAMLLGVAVVIGGAWVALDGGPARVTEVASGLGRLELMDLQFSWTSAWSLWGAVPHWVLAMLSFYMADQITAQRFLSAKTTAAAQRSYVANCVALTLLMPGLMYIGLCLLTFYHDHPGKLNGQWVANVDNLTGQPLRDEQGRDLLDWNNPQHALTPENLPELIRQHRLRRPNDKEPFVSADDLLVGDTTASDAQLQVDVEKLLMRKPGQGELRGEVMLHRRAAEEMLPRFISTQLPWGAAGIILAALLAASMSSIDSGLNSICTLFVMDLHRRYGWGREWLGRRVNKPAAELNEEDELKLAQPLTLAIGIGATLFAMLVAQVGDIFDIMVAIVNTFGAPLLAIYLLGIFTRRCTSTAALAALVIGTLFTVYLMAVNRFDALAILWPLDTRINSIWTVTFGTVFTFILGYLLSFAFGTSKTKAELRGLVAGCGTLGIRAIDEEVPLISLPEAERWK